jgi:hypothetical protein
VTDTSIIFEVFMAVFAGGAAWGGSKVALNGTRLKVKEIDAKLEQHIKDDSDIQTQVVDRLARIETKLDFLKEVHEKKA